MFSKYIDNSNKEDGTYLSIDEIITNIMNYDQWRTPQSDPHTNEPLRYEIGKIFDDNQQIEIMGLNITYNYIKYSYDTVISGQENNPISAERLRQISGAIVIYSDGTRTQYLMDRARGANALRILRIINNSGKNKIIEAQSFGISEDLFIWLISRFMADNRLIDEEEELVISRIIGFKGEGSQSQAILSGSGNEVMNLFSSLSFLIEMDEMTEIEVRLEHRESTYELRFYSKNSQVDVLVENYVGEYMMLRDEDKDPKVLLSTFIEIIPTIINSYNEEKNNNVWTDESKREFTLELAESVRQRLAQLLNE